MEFAAQNIYLSLVKLYEKKEKLRLAFSKMLLTVDRKIIKSILFFEWNFV